MLFFSDVSEQIKVADREVDLGRGDRGLCRAIYVPAGVPMWTRFTKRHRFRHLDLHLHQDRLMRFLTPALGSSAARTALRQSVELQDPGPVATLGSLVADELSTATRHPAFAENLIGSIVTGLMDMTVDASESPAQTGRLTQAQMNRLSTHFSVNGEQRMSVSEMAALVGLSESWFATVFRQTTGKTPLQWQLSRRIEAARQLLDDEALQHRRDRRAIRLRGPGPFHQGLPPVHRRHPGCLAQTPRPRLRKRPAGSDPTERFELTTSGGSSRRSRDRGCSSKPRRHHWRYASRRTGC